MPDRADSPTRTRPGSRILAIAGGSCSGKTTLSDLVLEELGRSRSTIIRTDDYYRADLVERAQGAPVNFDLPNALDVELLHAHLLELQRGHAVNSPQWDFVSHRRRRETVRYAPTDVIVVEGIFALHAHQLVTLYDHSCFIECPEKVRLERRIVRDAEERGRTESSVRDQFQSQVAPMHDEYVEPTKYMARRIVSQSEFVANPRAVVEELISTVTGVPFESRRFSQTLPGDGS